MTQKAFDDLMQALAAVTVWTQRSLRPDLTDDEQEAGPDVDWVVQLITHYIPSGKKNPRALRKEVRALLLDLAERL